MHFLSFQSIFLVTKTKVNNNFFTIRDTEFGDYFFTKQVCFHKLIRKQIVIVSQVFIYKTKYNTNQDQNLDWKKLCENKNSDLLKIDSSNFDKM